MSTIVFLHAHPDDEASGTSGTMARAVDEGHRVVTVFATNGDHGECPDDLAEGETLVERRRKEAAASAEAIGVQRVERLGYSDSGMTGWEQNGHELSFHLADTDEAARRLVAILDEEGADVLVGYDWHGGYGHPDHIKVHAVAHRAAELAQRPPRMLEVTMNRDYMRGLRELAKAMGQEMEFDVDAPADDGNPIGTPEAELHWQVDITPWLSRKRAALSAHASQTSDVGMMLSLPEEAFAMGFGKEHYIEPGREPGMVVGWPFEAKPIDA